MRSGSSAARVMCAWFGCIQSSQPGGVDDRAGKPVVVRVRVRADDEPDVLEPQAGLGERALELPERAGLGHPRVDEHDAAAGGDRERVHVRHARPRKRQPKSPNSGLDPVGAAELSLFGAHPGIMANRPRWTPRLA